VYTHILDIFITDLTIHKRIKIVILNMTETFLLIQFIMYFIPFLKTHFENFDFLRSYIIADTQWKIIKLKKYIFIIEHFKF